MKDIEQALAALFADTEKQEKAKKSLRKRGVNTYQEKVAEKQSNGEYKARIVDTRLLSPHWSDEARILYIRGVSCLRCKRHQEAPNEFLFVRKSHYLHGVLEQAIPPHEAQYDHLPVRVERHETTLPICQHCLTRADTDTQGRAAQTELDLIVDTDSEGTDSDDTDLASLFDLPQMEMQA